MSLVVRVMPSDKMGCGFYRCWEPARVVAAGDADVEIQTTHDFGDEGHLNIYSEGRMGAQKIIGVDDPECDVLVMQRPANRLMAECIPFVQAHGTAVVCDFDDDFDTLPTDNPAYDHYDPVKSPESNKVWAKQASALCDLVTVTTPALRKRYGAHGRVVELPNYVPESYLSVTGDPRLDRFFPVLGYAGSATHSRDLQTMQKAPAAAVWSRNYLFRALGTRSIITDCGFVIGTTDNIELVAPVNIEGYAPIVASFDVGLAPLEDTVFNKAKSWLKPLELMALGVPYVASPSPPYRALERLTGSTGGILVNTMHPNRGVWEKAILTLLEDPNRKERVEAGREKVRNARLTYEAQGERWLQAWSDALAMRRAG